MKRSFFFYLLLCFLGSSPISYAQENLSIETRANAKLYEVPSWIPFPTTNRSVNHISSKKSKLIRKPVYLQVIDFTNVTHSQEYDAYVVNYKNKRYFIRSSDVSNNEELERRSHEIIEQYRALQDSINQNYRPVQTYNHLIAVLDSRIDSCNRLITYDLIHEDSLKKDIAKKRTLDKAQQSIENYQRRRQSYNEWVSSLPKKAQTAALIIAIPEKELTIGYYGACDISIAFVNMSPKTIKYLYWNGMVKNAIGDYVSCDISNSSTFYGKYTGPCYQYEDERLTWENVLFNYDARELILSSIRIIYTDGSQTTLDKQTIHFLTNIPKSIFDDGIFKDYSMASPFEQEYDLDEEIKWTQKIWGDEINREFSSRQYEIKELLNLYEEAKQFFTKTEQNHTTIQTYIENGRVFYYLKKDLVLMDATKDYCEALAYSEDITRRFKAFKRKYFGFI